jgi:hypothetical protein
MLLDEEALPKITQAMRRVAEYIEPFNEEEAKEMKGNEQFYPYCFSMLVRR